MHGLILKTLTHNGWVPEPDLPELYQHFTVFGEVGISQHQKGFTPIFAKIRKGKFLFNPMLNIGSESSGAGYGTILQYGSFFMCFSKNLHPAVTSDNVFL
jgi:hypothetical protein